MFSNAIKLCSLNGFDIKVDPSWILIAALVTWSLSDQYFPATYPDQTSQTYLTMAFIAMLGFFASLLLHELAHSVVARRLGLEIKGITLFLFGGVAEMENEPKNATVELWVAIAGPVMSLSLSFGFWVLAGLADLLPTAPALGKVLSYLAMINLVLALFNMVPAFPLDGGRVLRAWLWHRSGDVLKATETAARSGATFAYILMALGVMAMFQGAVAAGLWQIMIGGFVLMAARARYQNQLARSLFAGRTVGTLMRRDPVTVDPETTLNEFVNGTVLHHGVSFVPVVENGVLLGHMSPDVLTGIDRENWSSTRVGDVFAGLDADRIVSPDMPVEELMSLITRTGQRKFLVVRDHKLVGVISLADLTRFISVAAAPRAAPA